MVNQYAENHIPLDYSELSSVFVLEGGSLYRRKRNRFGEYLEAIPMDQKFVFWKADDGTAKRVPRLRVVYTLMTGRDPGSMKVVLNDDGRPVAVPQSVVGLINWHKKGASGVVRTEWGYEAVVTTKEGKHASRHFKRLRDALAWRREVFADEWGTTLEELGLSSLLTI